MMADRHRLRTHFQFAALVMTVAILPGCGDSGGGVGRFPVQGMVTFDGSPVESGRIVFVPADAAGVKVGTEIRDGKYALEAGRGPAAGKHAVEINVDKKTGKKLPSNDPPNMIDEVKQIAPAKYNTKTTLSADVRAAANTFNFELTSK